MKKEYMVIISILIIIFVHGFVNIYVGHNFFDGWILGELLLLGIYLFIGGKF